MTPFTDRYLRVATIAREMKELKPRVPILIVSGTVEEPSELEFTDGFPSKGEAPDILLDTIARLLSEPQGNSAPKE